MIERIVAAFVPLVAFAVLVAAREQGFAADDVPTYLRQFAVHTPFADVRAL